MRVYGNSVGRWCKYINEDEMETGIVFYGGQDKNPNDPGYRNCVVWTQDLDGLRISALIEVDWPDVKELGPIAGPPRGCWIT